MPSYTTAEARRPPSVVAGGVVGEVSEEIAGLGCADFDVEVGDVEGYGGVFVDFADAYPENDSRDPLCPARATQLP